MVSYNSTCCYLCSNIHFTIAARSHPLKKPNRKSLFNALFLIVVFALTMTALFKGEDPARLADSLQLAKMSCILPAVACVILFILGESVQILYLMRTLGQRVSFRHCCLYSFIGFFYSCITPSASGGQPMQVIAMRKDKIPVPVSTVVLAIITITYKLVLVLIGLSVMLIRPEGIMRDLVGVDALVYLGLALNVGCIALLLMLVFKPIIVRRCAEIVLTHINHIRPFKKPERIYRRLDELMNQYTGTAEYYRTHHLVILNVLLVTFLQRICLFAVTWFAYRSFGLSGESALTIITLQAMISVVVDMLPLPGGMGISENLFLQIFEPIFGAALVLPGLVISRGISYYTQLAISAVMTLASTWILRKRNDEGEHHK